MVGNEDLFNALSTLQSAAERIRRIEEEARKALYAGDDTEKHRQKLHEKTMLLIELPDLVDPFYKNMPKNIRAEFQAGLQSFALRATQALELSSIFYMSALLYPDDYREGEPNDLEVFIDRLRTMCLS